MHKIYGSLDQALTSNELFVFLHGLPGIRTRQNQDLAENLFKTLNKNSVLFFYPGAGVAEGIFSFQKTYALVKNFIQEVILKNPNIKIHLVGHSFGGYLSLRLCKDFPESIQTIFLLSPLVFVLKERSMVDLFNSIQASHPEVKTADMKSLQEDYQKFIEGYDPIELKKYLNHKKIKYVQSAPDDITPASSARAYINDLPTIEYIEIDQDHSFLVDRNEIKNLFVQFVQNNSLLST